jgi:superfamily II DNA or RNA helicase/ubiquinone/menaquinone biosynthesis C-methylase UbiE
MKERPKLKPYQYETGVELHEKGKIIIADSMGLGKTAQTLAARVYIERRDEMDYKTLVIAPSSVLPHWQREIRKWYDPLRGRESSIGRIRTTTFEEDITTERKKESDFVMLSYDTLSRIGKERGNLQRIEDLGFGYVILDEGHNAKNPRSIQSASARQLVSSAKYLAIPTGTPVPNSFMDILVLLSILDPNNFKIDDSNKCLSLRKFYSLFVSNPELISDAFTRHIVSGAPRTLELYGHRTLPKIEQKILEVPLVEEHAEVYRAIYENDDIKAASKLRQLRQIALDPNLARRNLLNGELARRLGNMESCVYKMVDPVLESIVDEGGKALIYVDFFKEGVVEYLKGRWARFKPLIIDGDDKTREIEGFDGEDNEKREFIRNRFQRSKDYKLLISTTVMDEGVDLTAATSAIHLRLPYDPATFDQRNARTARIGEVDKDKLDIYIVRTLLEGIPTVDEGVERVLHDKRKVIEFILGRNTSVSTQDLETIMTNGHPQKAEHLGFRIKSPKSMIIDHISRNIKNRGFSYIRKFNQEREDQAEIFAKLYAQNWEGSYGGNTGNLYARIIRVLEEMGDFRRKLDIASGPFSLSRAIKQPVTNVDINPFMLEAGRILEREGKIVQGNIALEGCFHDLPVETASFDLALCSLAMHATKLSVNYEDENRKRKNIREREGAFREMNRVLRPEGLGLIALPQGVIIEKDLEGFYQSLGKLGLDVLPFSGFYKGGIETDYRVFIAGLKKTTDPQEENLEDSELVWHMDTERLRKRSGKERKGGMPKFRSEQTTEIVREFFNVRTKETLDDCIRRSLR